MGLAGSVKGVLRNWRPAPWVIRLLPGTSRLFGPPRRMRAGLELAGARRVDVPFDLPMAAATCLNDVHPFWQNPHPLLPDPVTPWILTVDRARLLAPGAWVVVGRDTFVYDASFWGHKTPAIARKWHGVFLRKKPRRTRHLTGHVLSLASDFAPYSYGHWLIDSLPRWLFMERAGLAPDDFDAVYCPAPDSPSTRRLMGALGIPAARLLTMPPDCDFTVDRLTATSFPGSPGTISSLARAMAVRLHPPRKPQRRLYLARNGFRRNFGNHDELLPVFAEFGFEVCDPMADPEVIAKCSEARIIAGIEGSQCLNALFAPSGGALVVFAPDEVLPLHDHYMRAAAAVSGLALFFVGVRTADAGLTCHLAPAELRRALADVTAAHP